jgi:tRNA A-37 threonylcarbamoyl transferase component Bud32
LARQVAALHRLGLVHGDIKARNILVRVCPRTKCILDIQLADWGTLVHLGAATELSAT